MSDIVDQIRGNKPKVIVTSWCKDSAAEIGLDEKDILDVFHRGRVRQDMYVFREFPHYTIGIKYKRNPKADYLVTAVWKG